MRSRALQFARAHLQVFFRIFLHVLEVCRLVKKFKERGRLLQNSQDSSNSQAFFSILRILKLLIQCLRNWQILEICVRTPPVCGTALPLKCYWLAGSGAGGVRVPGWTCPPSPATPAALVQHMCGVGSRNALAAWSQQRPPCLCHKFDGGDLRGRARSLRRGACVPGTGIFALGEYAARYRHRVEVRTPVSLLGARKVAQSPKVSFGGKRPRH